MKQIVTARCGFKGSALVPKFLALGHEVVAIYQHSALKDRDCGHNLRWMQKARYL